MGQIYLKFKTNDIRDSGQQSMSRLTQSIEEMVVKVLTPIIPKANPDFDDKIQNVKEWIIEIEESDGSPLREIGIDDKGNVIMIMPWKDNCGFWTDNNVQIDNLAKSHEMAFVDKIEFEKLWRDFEKQK